MMSAPTEFMLVELPPPRRGVEAGFKSRYGITYQHTFVKVDDQGNIIKKMQGPSDKQLLELLQ
jgi:hypothetical protein